MLSEPKRTGVSTNQKESAEWAAAMESRIVESGLTSRAAKAQQQTRNDQHSRRNPNPEDFASDNGKSSTREEPPELNGGYSNRVE